MAFPLFTSPFDASPLGFGSKPAESGTSFSRFSALRGTQMPSATGFSETTPIFGAPVPQGGTTFTLPPSSAASTGVAPIFGAFTLPPSSATSTGAVSATTFGLPMTDRPVAQGSRISFGSLSLASKAEAKSFVPETPVAVSPESKETKKRIDDLIWENNTLLAFVRALVVSGRIPPELHKSFNSLVAHVSKNHKDAEFVTAATAMMSTLES